MRVVDFFLGLRLKTLSNVVTALLVVAVLVSLIGSLVGMWTLADVKATWTGYMRDPGTKARALADLRVSLGFGGFVHNFKNYVLRQDPMYLEGFEENLGAVRAALAAYRAAGVNAEEGRALDAIAGVVDLYADNRWVVEDMIAAGKSPRELDSFVRVDDGPAMVGLARLESELQAGRQRALQALDTSVARMTFLLTASASVVAGFLLLMAFSNLWFTRARLVGPLSRLRETMVGLARGDIEVEVPQVRARDEIGDMAAAVQVFKEQAIARLQADKALRKSEARFRVIAQSTPVPVAVVHLTEDRVLFANLAFERVFCVTSDKRDHDNARDCGNTRRFFADLRQRAAVVRELARKGRIRDREYRFSRCDGTEFWGSLSAEIVNFQGEPAVFSAVIDISDRKKAEDAMRAAKENAELANRTKSEFLANMSHELRTPLNAILGFSEVIVSQMFGPLGNQRYIEYAKDIHASGNHLLAIINDILDLSKIEAGQMPMEEELVAVPEAIDSCLTLVAGRAGRAEVNISKEIPPDLPRLRADGRKLKQILVNLLSNAIKFTSAGGQVTVGAAVNGTGEFELVVRDTGIGMSDDEISRALEPFNQVDTSLARKYEGTGLGLPLAKLLCELHGGSLDIDSQVGVGTTVTVRVPAERVVWAARRAAGIANPSGGPPAISGVIRS